MDIKRHLYQHRKYQYNFVIVELSRTDLGQTFFFPFGRIGLIDFFFQLVKLEQTIFWIEDFQLVKMEQTIFGQTIFNLVNGRVILEERIFIKEPRKLRGDRGNEFRNNCLKMYQNINIYTYTHTHTMGEEKTYMGTSCFVKSYVKFYCISFKFGRQELFVYI